MLRKKYSSLAFLLLFFSSSLLFAQGSGGGGSGSGGSGSGGSGSGGSGGAGGTHAYDIETTVTGSSSADVEYDIFGNLEWLWVQVTDSDGTLISKKALDPTRGTRTESFTGLNGADKYYYIKFTGIMPQHLVVEATSTLYYSSMSSSLMHISDTIFEEGCHGTGIVTRSMSDCVHCRERLQDTNLCSFGCKECQNSCSHQGASAYQNPIDPAIWRGRPYYGGFGTSGSCGSCGVSPGDQWRAGPRISCDFAFLPQQLIQTTDIGPAMCTQWSSKISLFNWTSATRENMIEFFDASTGSVINFLYNENVIGEFNDTKTSCYVKMEVKDSGGNATDNLANADEVKLYMRNGRTMTFEVADLDDRTGYYDLHGRLTKVTECNGYETSITYDHTAPPTAAPSKFWMITKVTDPYGADIDFDYNTSQQFGRWSVSKLTLPTGGEVDFNYTDGFFSGADYPDGTSSSVTYTEDLTNNTMEIEWFDPHAIEPRRRDMTAKVTLDYVYLDDVFIEDIANQPAGVLIQLKDGDDQAVCTIYTNPSNANQQRMVIDGCLLEVNRGYSVAFYKTWSQSSASYSGFSGTLEAVYGSNLTATETQVYTGTVPTVRDNQGREYDYVYTTDAMPEKKTYSDSTFEKWEYNADGFVTRFRDRLGRVTKFVFDSQCNLTKTKVGILEISGTDTNQTEYAEWDNEYYGSSHANKYLLKEVKDPLYNSSNPELHSTIYSYDSSHRVNKIEYSADLASGTRPDVNFTYNSAGLVYTSTDEEGRVTTFYYDDMGRLEKTTFNDTSTEQTLYGDTNSASPGMVLKTKDRNDIVTSHTYDDNGNRLVTKVGVEIDSDLFNAPAATSTGIEQEISRAYANGTCQISSVTTNGNKVSMAYDYRARPKTQTTHHYAGKSTTSLTHYENNEVFYTENDLGARVYTGYEATDGTSIRTITETVDGGVGTLADNSAVLAKTRDSGNNAKYLITDATRDDGGDVTEIINGKGVSTEVVYDSIGREIRRLEAEGTTIERKTERDYDDANNVTEIRHPRYFDSGDTNGYQKDKTVITYTGRNQVKDRTRASDHTLAATTSYTYSDDGRVEKRNDPESHDWFTYYHSCCGRLLGSKNPLGHGRFSNTDYGGRVTHTVHVEDYATHTTSHNPTDSKTYGETTTRYDARGRVEAATRWLTARGVVDEQDPDIAGLDGVSETLGLTTQFLYDEDLTDNVGLDSSTGVTVNKLGGGGTYNVSIDDCLTKLAATTANGGAGVSFGTDNVGSAIVAIDAEERLSVSIVDAGGRTVMVAQIESYEGTIPNGLITWSCSKSVVEGITGYGDVDSRWTIDAGGNVSKTRVDSIGRVIESEDADNNISTYKYDANGQAKEFRDPNGVGYDVVYNELGHITSRIDTYGDVVKFTYDDAGNQLTVEDAKNETITNEYDVLGRKIKATDRLAGETEYGFDKNNNLSSITDSEDQITSYEFDDANQKTKTTYPDHDAMASAGDSDYGIVEFKYDPAGRIQVRTDQLGDTCTYNYDLASRLTSKDYRLRVNSPSGTIADTDTFTYDDASRMLTAVSGRYSNTVTKTYDDAGRLETEELTIGTGMSQKSYEVEREYNDLNQLWKLTYPDSTVVERSYTDRGQLYTVKYGTTTIDTRTYDVGGRLFTSTYGNGVVTTYFYRNDTGDKDNQIASINIAKGMTTIDDFDFTYDANKNVTSESRAGTMSNYGWTTDDNGSAGFDKDDRLTYWKRDDSNLTQVWSLSLVGNWNSITENTVSTTHTHGDAHELTAVGSNNLSFDAKGNMTTRYDGDDYSWDFDNQLTGTDIDASAGDDVTFEYDALGRRVRKDNGTDDTVYVHAGQQVIAEYGFGAAAISPTEQYAYGAYIDEPIIKYGTLSSGTGFVYYHHDRRYSVVALSDTSGAAVERYAYSPYGDLSVFDGSGNSISSTAYANSITFTGRIWDENTELCYFRARYYSPESGNFVTRDPHNYADGPSMYRGYFIPGNVDPYGRDVWTLSGVNNVDDKTGTFVDYVGEWAKENGITVNERESFASHAGSTKWYFDNRNKFHVHYCKGVRSRASLNADARQECFRFLHRQFCKGDKPKKILVLMMGPKTHVLPPPKSKCCEVDAKVWIDVKDGVPNQGVNNNGGGSNVKHLAEFWSSWGETFVIHGKGGDSSDDYPFHTLDNYVNPPYEWHAYHSGSAGRVYETPRRLEKGPLEKYKELKDQYDEVMFCHSQGCNITMFGLHKACGTYRQEQLGDLDFRKCKYVKD